MTTSDKPTLFNPGFTTMAEIGKKFGVSSHIIGRWLKSLGLRTGKGMPSTKAIRLQMVTKVGNVKPYFYAWHETKTLAALKAAGQKPA